MRLELNDWRITYVLEIPSACIHQNMDFHDLYIKIFLASPKQRGDSPHRFIKRGTVRLREIHNIQKERTREEAHLITYHWNLVEEVDCDVLIILPFCCSN